METCEHTPNCWWLWNQSQPDGLLLLFSVSNTYSFHMFHQEHTFHVHHQKRKKIKNKHFQTGRWAFLSISLDFDGTAHMLPVTYLFLRGTWGAVCFIVRCYSLGWQITCWTQHWWQPPWTHLSSYGLLLSWLLGWHTGTGDTSGPSTTACLWSALPWTDRAEPGSESSLCVKTASAQSCAYFTGDG